MGPTCVPHEKDGRAAVDRYRRVSRSKRSADPPLMRSVWLLRRVRWPDRAETE